MARKPVTAEDELRQMLAERTGLLAPEPSRVTTGLLAAVPQAPAAQLPMPAPQQKGLLSPPQRRGLLSPEPPRSRMAQAGNFLDDVLFGGAAGDARAEREARDQARLQAEAHREAFSYAMTPQGFDPNRYGARMGELGQAPDMASITNMEGIADGQDVRGLRQRQEQRGVTAGALAPISRLPAEQQPGALAGVNDYLQGAGFGINPNINPGNINAAIGAGMGADGYLDNDRGDRNLAEQQRQNVSAEQFRNSDLGFRKEESAWERQYREGRAQAEDRYRSEEMDYKREALTAPNSTGDVIAPILSKVATMGPEALSEGERLIWERYQQSGQNPFAAMMGGMAPPVPAGPAAAPTRQAPQADPFPGIPEGGIVEQDGVRYQRRGSQMVRAQ